MWLMIVGNRTGSWTGEQSCAIVSGDTDRNGSVRSENMSTIAPSLCNYLQCSHRDWDGRARNIARLAFGPELTLAAWTSEHFWDPVAPHSMDLEVHQWLEHDVYESGKRLEHITLGYGGAHMVIYQDGTITGNLQGHYDLLRGALASVRAANVLVR